MQFYLYFNFGHSCSCHLIRISVFLSFSSLTGQLRTLIVEAQSRGLQFVYALSPGQDVVFSSSCDLTLLKRKLRQVCYNTWIIYNTDVTVSLVSHTEPLLFLCQVSDLGCQAFAILFDDIDHSMCQADSEAFASFAHAQVTVTNEIYRFLEEPPVFLFCPTGRTGVEISYILTMQFLLRETLFLPSL